MIECPSSTNETATKPIEDLSEYIISKTDTPKIVPLPPAA